ncbi:multiheme c-type cytochrome [Campylobacter geochelonis]|uniref:multiheme c-type cytochrome n=1 Tax=Campylobacter geochelonis TaxID=1780362 RepID=UPI000770AFF4|nr:multiheme c-type cytochrome [Campylobacter geochelonis]CZE50620.1 Uncharacterised protein [Campylobacter geochelonis]
MKYFLILLLAVTLSNAKIIQRFVAPTNCSACHQEQVKDWMTSLHAKSHTDKNELYHEAVKIVARDLRQPYENVLVKCGDCHNPRLEVAESELDENYMLAKAFVLETTQSEHIDKALTAKHIQNGISCYVCHNVNSIKEKHNNQDVGFNVLEWIPNDTIVGPFTDPNNRAGFHKSEIRDYFVTGNDLCLACHQGQATENKLSVYDTGKELESTNDTRRCVDCHMGSLKQEIIAPNMKPNLAQKRTIRSHLFAGIRNDSKELKEYVNLGIKVIGSTKANIEIENLATHNLPSGFSGRSVVLNLKFLKGTTELSSSKIGFEKVYRNKIGSRTLSYAADRLVSDSTLKPLEKREISIDIPAGTTSIKADLLYYVLAPEVKGSMQIKNDAFTKPYTMKSMTFNLN